MLKCSWSSHTFTFTCYAGLKRKNWRVSSHNHVWRARWAPDQIKRTTRSEVIKQYWIRSTVLWSFIYYLFRHADAAAEKSQVSCMYLHYINIKSLQNGLVFWYICSWLSGIKSFVWLFHANIGHPDLNGWSWKVAGCEIKFSLILKVFFLNKTNICSFMVFRRRKKVFHQHNLPPALRYKVSRFWSGN